MVTLHIFVIIYQLVAQQGCILTTCIAGFAMYLEKYILMWNLINSRKSSRRICQTKLQTWEVWGVLLWWYVSAICYTTIAVTNPIVSNSHHSLRFAMVDFLTRIFLQTVRILVFSEDEVQTTRLQLPISGLIKKWLCKNRWALYYWLAILYSAFAQARTKLSGGDICEEVKSDGILHWKARTNSGAVYMYIGIHIGSLAPTDTLWSWQTRLCGFVISVVRWHVQVSISSGTGLEGKGLHDDDLASENVIKWLHTDTFSVSDVFSQWAA